MHIEAGATTDNGHGQIRRYFLVSDFYAADTNHWRMMRQMAESIQVGPEQALVATFLDLSQHYEPSPVGEIVGPPYMQRVIAQYIDTSHGKQLFIADPLGFGTYTEPGEVPSNFGI
jgi:hypothetical protein